MPKSSMTQSFHDALKIGDLIICNFRFQTNRQYLMIVIEKTEQRLIFYSFFSDRTLGYWSSEVDENYEDGFWVKA